MLGTCGPNQSLLIALRNWGTPSSVCCVDAFALFVKFDSDTFCPGLLFGTTFFAPKFKVRFKTNLNRLTLTLTEIFKIAKCEDALRRRAEK